MVEINQTTLTEWATILPVLIIGYNKTGKRYVRLKENEYKNMIESSLVYQHGYIRCYQVLDIIDKNKIIKDALEKYGGINEGEFNDIVNAKYTNISTKNHIHDIDAIYNDIINRLPDGYNKIIPNMFTVQHSVLLSSGLEKIVPFYKGINYPDFPLEEIFRRSYGLNNDHYCIARFMDYLIWGLIKDPDRTGEFCLYSGALKAVDKSPFIEKMNEQKKKRLRKKTHEYFSTTI